MYDCRPFHFRDCYIDYWLWATVPGILLLVGMVGNTLNIIILSRKRIRKFSTSVYLMFLAVSDLLFMLSSCLPETVNETTGKRLENTSYFMCKTNHWIVHTSAGFSVWLLVLLTIERVLLTKWPYVAKARLSSRNALKASLVMAVMCALFPAHYFFGFELRLDINNFNQTRYNCQPLPGEYYLFDQYPWKVMVLVVLNIIPMCIITAGNLTILATIVKQKRQLHRVAPNTAIGASVAQRRQKSSTRMLFILSSFFMVTTMPFTLFRVYKEVYPAIGAREYARQRLTETITALLLYCNFTFNFFMYFVSGTLFKQEWRCFTADAYVRLRKAFCRSEPPGTRVSVIGPSRQTLTGQTQAHNDTIRSF
ncbi:hypothetical protein DPMN_181474 [Dreissena polymorpha]|uniref:G-protein coupled receptors family 1 profile domain-containing protein n=1 Tax=Dreissena polymorpha TaxID=45954 RepID=A0A9D4I4F9_DREPO|nr:hypothetical protein DPMN_181474 [Dreissena polymorpha]